MSIRAWLSVITLALIAVLVYFSRHELLQAWALLERVNIWVLLLLIPGQILVYYFAGEMLFSYLRSKGSIKHIPPHVLARLSLEMNFVNHVLPSGGVSGISYMGWRLGGYGVPASRATMGQAVRYSMGFVSFVLVLAVAVFVVTIDGNVNRWIILVSSLLAGGMTGTILGGVYIISDRRRMDRFAHWLDIVVNTTVRRATFGRVRHALHRQSLDSFFDELHDDYIALRREKRVLLKPFLWGLVYNIGETMLFWITFAALGWPVNPAPILIAYGVASTASFFVATPGGAGAYEAIMVTFLAIAGIDKGTAIAGIVLTRVFQLIGAVGIGYLFYQHALIKYGKSNKDTIV